MVSRQKLLLLLLVCCAFASFGSAQSVSITFLNDWGEQATKVLEHGKALLRVVDSGANTTPGPDSVTVDLSSTLVSDWATTDLVETGNGTGVFEGEVNLTTDYYANYLADSEYLAIWSQPGVLDTATATYGAVSDSVEASPSLTDLLDESGWSPADFAVGERVQVRVRDRRADRYAGPDTVVAEVVSSGGDVETLTLIETGSRTAVFEASLGLVAGSPASQDGRLQAAAANTITVTHPDGNGFSSSSDSAAVSPATVRFINWRKAAPADPFVEGGEVAARVVDPAANSNPTVIESVPVTFYRGNDQEALNLRETGADTGVFEGRLRLRSNSWGWNNGFLEQHSLLDISYKGKVAVAYGSLLSYADWTYSTIRLFDEEGEEASGVALGETVRVRVKAAENLYSADADSVRIRVQDAATGDEETLVFWETGGYTWLFEGNLRPEPGAAVPGDGRIQAQAGDTLQISHLDPVGLIHTSVTIPVRRSRVRYLDANGNTASVLLNGDKARVEVLDLLAGGQPPLAGISSLLGSDDEDLSLSAFGPPGLFRGSMPLTLDWSLDGDGVLYTSWSTYPVNQLDTVTATANDASASLQAAQSILEFTDAQGEPVDSAVAGARLYVRANAPMGGGSFATPDSLFAYITSLRGGDTKVFYLTETSPGTRMYEGWIDTNDTYSYGVPLFVHPADTVQVRYDPVNNPYETDMDRALAVLPIVPVRLVFVDGEGRATSTFLYNEPIRMRVDEPAANADPFTAESITVKVRAWRQADDRQDVETVTLTETGTDTGTFTGSLPGSAIYYSWYPSQENGVLEYPELTPPYSDTTTVVATRGDVSRNATLKDSDLWLTDLQGNDADSFPIGSTMKVWLRRPRGNVSAGVDNDYVEVWTRTDTVDMEPLTLVETGASTGLFIGTLPIVASPQTSGNGTLGGSPGDPIEAHKISYSLLSFDMGVLVAATAPVATDDSAMTNEESAVAIPLLENDYNSSGAPLTVSGVTQGSFGSVTINPSGTVTYTPGVNFHGSDSFSYTLSEPSGLTDNAAVSITVAPVNDVPDAVDDTAATITGAPVAIAVLANDTDPDGDTLLVVYVWHPLNGTATVNANGTITYTPNAGFQGTDTFSYMVQDGPGGPSDLVDTALVTITVQGNRAPDAVNDSATTNEDAPVTVSVKSNDTDPDGDTLTITAVTQGTKGSVSINAGSTVTYTPNANANGSDSFTYTISDGRGGVDTATVAVTIAPVNDAPDAVDDSATTNEDTAKTVLVRSNDTDIDGNTLTITAVTQGTKGSVSINAGTSVTYTPNANATGSDSFTYTISDGDGGTDTATVSITITAVNDVPDAVNDSVITDEDVAATIAVKSNDTDGDGDNLTITAVTQGTKGSVVINGDGTVAYTPNADVNGTDSFTYTISDGNGGTDTATVSVTITSVNDRPDAVNDSAVTNEDTPVTVSVRSNDTDVEGDNLLITDVTQGTKGSVGINNGATVTYTPNANANGSDSFTYTIWDGNGLTDTATVSITINPVNDPPIAVNDSAATLEDVSVPISVLANDSDVDGTISVTSVTQGTKGSVTTNGTLVTYIPALNTSGADAFTYTISDGQGGTATAAVTVSVSPVNDAPLAVPDNGATRENVSISISVLANDTDVEGNSLTLVSATTPANGSTSAQPNGTVIYTPQPNFTGTNTFTYTMSDGQGGSSVGQVTVLVGEALERVAVLATNSVALRTGSDVLSGDVIVNQAGAGPFLNGAELSLGGTVTTPANYDVEGDSLTVAAGAVVSSDARYNQLTNNGTISGIQTSPLPLPVFSALPPFLTATPGTTNVNVAMNGTLTLAAGNYQDLVVGKKGTVTFTGGIYHFRTITVDREAKLYFSAASEVRVQQKINTKVLTTIGPAVGATIDASSILIYVAGVNGTTGALAATPKAVEIGGDNTLKANLYAPNGTIWLQDSTQATGAFLGKDIDVGVNVQVTLDSAFSGGQ